jgi:hypothetical protein
MSQQASVSSCDADSPAGSCSASACGSGSKDLDVGQRKIGGQRVAIFHRLVKMLAGVEEDHLQGRVNAPDHVQQHGRIRAKRRHCAQYRNGQTGRSTGR